MTLHMLCSLCAGHTLRISVSAGLVQGPCHRQHDQATQHLRALSLQEVMPQFGGTGQVVCPAVVL